jgi:carboxylesterase type B
VTASNPFALKPVMLWIHGGGFTIGSGTEREYDPTRLLDKDVVVVSINYRLGPLGFMTFGNNKVVGNMGLKDQNMAIKWVKNYIRYFGGNPDKITIFGVSAGGISVHAQILSPFNHGLLAGAIAQSGTMLFKQFQTKGLGNERIAVKAANAFNCSSQGLDDEMLSCLQDVPVENLIEMTQMPIGEFGEASDVQYAWNPIVDYFSYEPFLPIQPIEALKKGIYNHVPFMSGTTKDEGGLMTLMFYEQLAEVYKNWKNFAQDMIGIDNDAKSFILANIIKKYYTGDDFSKENKQSIIDMFTDMIFLSPDQKSVSLMSEGRSPVFNYQLTYKGTNTFASLFGPAAAEDDFGVFHGDDLLYLFKSSLFVDFEEQTEEDQKMTELMVTYWTNFAKYGNPTPFKIANASNWTPVQTGQKNYLDLQIEPTMKENLEPERMLFWDRMLWSHLEDAIDRRIILDKVSNFLKKYRKQNL